MADLGHEIVDRVPILFFSSKIFWRQEGYVLTSKVRSPLHKIIGERLPHVACARGTPMMNKRMVYLGVQKLRWQNKHGFFLRFWVKLRKRCHSENGF